MNRGPGNHTPTPSLFPNPPIPSVIPALRRGNLEALCMIVGIGGKSPPLVRRAVLGCRGECREIPASERGYDGAVEEWNGTVAERFDCPAAYACELGERGSP